MSLQTALVQLQTIIATAVDARVTYQYLPAAVQPASPFVLTMWQRTEPDAMAYGSAASKSKGRKHRVLLVIGVGVNRPAPWADKDSQTYAVAALAALDAANTLNGTCASVTCGGMAPAEMRVNDGMWATVQGDIVIQEFI